MSNYTSIGVSAMEGKTYIVGREGNIYVRDLSVSRQHAEIKFIDGRIRLRDLNSTNGTYLLKNNRRIKVVEGYVKPHQPVIMGSWQCTIQSLLAIAGIFVTYSEKDGLTIVIGKSS
jgi:pSer/pThr/pTyr-binding forkhead associated (FHA) protein